MLRSFKVLLFLLPAFFFFLSAHSQEGSGTIRGFVYNKRTDEPIIYTNVRIQGTGMGAPTDEKGYFAINDVPAGTHTIQVTRMGFDTATATVKLDQGEVVTKKLFINKRRKQTRAVEIYGRKQERQENVEMSQERVEPEAIESMPSVGGSADLAQYLQVLPGVVFTGDQGGSLYIRGGSPIQNKVLLDGMVVHKPFHSIGLFSVFDTKIIQNADVYTGGFGAEYGGRISSIMDITTRDGDKEEYKGNISVDPFLGRAHVEGPISKPEEQGDSWSSFILSAKHSYLPSSSQALYTDLPTIGNEGLPYGFNDLYGKVSFNGASGSQADLFGFRHFDQVDHPDLPAIEWTTYGGGGSFTVVPGSVSLLMNGEFAYSQYEVSMMNRNDDGGGSGESSSDRTSAIQNFQFNLGFKYLYDRDHIKYGLDIMGNSTDFAFTNFANQRIRQEQNNTQVAGYLSYKMKRGNLVLEPGFRAQYYASIPEFSPEPRLGVKYNITDDFRLKGATGIYSQNLIGTSSQQDVVNIFNGFLTAPENLQKNFTQKNGKTRTVDHPLQKAAHYILGMEYDIKRGFFVELEGYFKDFLQLTKINHNKIFPDEPAYSDKPAELREDFIVQTGEAYGADLMVKYRTDRIRARAVYSIMKVTRWDGIREYAPVFDRRHSLNILGSYHFGKDKQWQVNARWNFGTGFPFTRNQAYYERFDLQDGKHFNYQKGNGDLGIVYEDINQGRLPPYHRLDLSIKHTWEFDKLRELIVGFSVTNAYDRRNIFYVDRITRERTDQLPILPSISAELSF